jgi:hypothetical protein
MTPVENVTRRALVVGTVAGRLAAVPSAEATPNAATTERRRRHPRHKRHKHGRGGPGSGFGPEPLVFGLVELANFKAGSAGGQGFFSFQVNCHYTFPAESLDDEFGMGQNTPVNLSADGIRQFILDRVVDTLVDTLHGKGMFVPKNQIHVVLL